nr:hypothetical protein GCM10020092_054930 [Actinoplanes digitatis]
MTQRPVSMTLGKIRTGSFVSSAMFTESSKPTIAKNASAVAAVTEKNAVSPGGELNSTSRETSPSPPPSAHAPMQMTISRPVSSTQVSRTFSLTLSPTPRKLIRAMRVMKPTATAVSPAPSPRDRSKASAKLLANAFDALDAEVRPEHITAKVTMKVRKWTPNALCVYRAAPTACGYLVTSSR